MYAACRHATCTSMRRHAHVHVHTQMHARVRDNEHAKATEATVMWRCRRLGWARRNGSPPRASALLTQLSVDAGASQERRETTFCATTKRLKHVRMLHVQGAHGREQGAARTHVSPKP